MRALLWSHWMLFPGTVRIPKSCEARMYIRKKGRGFMSQVEVPCSDRSAMADFRHL